MSKREKVMRASLRNERTGDKAKRLAAKWLTVCKNQAGLGAKGVFMPIEELATICASNLTQSPDRIVRATARPKKAGRVGRK